MTRNRTLSILKEQKPFLTEKFGVHKLGVFGSVARNEMGNDSDVDIVVDMVPDLFFMVHIKEILEEALNTSVDLVRYRDNMNSFLKECIDKEAVYV